MTPIRVVLGRMPCLLHDIVVQVLRGEPDMQIIGEARDEDGVGALLFREEADVVVVEHGICDGGDLGQRLLRRHPAIKVLVLSSNGRTADLHWLEMRLSRCADVSPGELVQLIRSACGRES